MQNVVLTFSLVGECDDEDRRNLRQLIIYVLADPRVRDRLSGGERRLAERLLLAEGGFGESLAAEH